MTDPRDRDDLVELIARYATMSDTKDFDELPRSVFCEEFTSDFSAFGVPAATSRREVWAEQTRQAFAGWVATFHSITNHLIVVEGDRATVRAHVRAEHWAPPQVAAQGPHGAARGSNCWLVVGFYDDVAERTADGWRLSAVKLTPTYQENAELAASLMPAAQR